MTGPSYILLWCTAADGLRSLYFSNTPEGRDSLKVSLARLSVPHVYFVRVYVEDTIAIVDMLAPKPA